MARRSSRRRASRSLPARAGNTGLQSALLVIVAISILAALATSFWWSERDRRAHEIDPHTLCPLATGPTGMTAILIDVTDPLSTAQHSKLLAWIEKEIDDAPKGTQFTLGIVSENGNEWGASPALCKPQGAGSANSFTQNAKLINNRYEREFLRPLKTRLTDMLEASGANRSPIMESLQTLLAQTPGFVTFRSARRIIIISDLLQHSSVLSFYRGEDWGHFAGSTSFQRISQSLLGASVKIYQIPRPGESVRRQEILEDFWLRYFDLQGAHLPVVTKLGDL